MKIAGRSRGGDLRINNYFGKLLCILAGIINDSNVGMELQQVS